MRRVALIHWNAAEAVKRAATLRRVGLRVSLPSLRSAAGRRALFATPPDVFVIDLFRLPSEGCAVAALIRQRTSTRRVPIVFAGGDPERTARARRLLPDAVFTDWGRIRSALRAALANPPANPVVPGTMDQYAGAPLQKKLLIRADSTLALLGAPAGFERTLGTLPVGVRLQRHARGPARTVVLFVRSRTELDRRLRTAVEAMDEKGALWIAWPKRSSGVVTDLTQSVIRACGLAAGLVDYKISMIDQTWSALCFARRGRRGRRRS
jgi:CheY-like chemotaxis protein